MMNDTPPNAPGSPESPNSAGAGSTSVVTLQHERGLLRVLLPYAGVAALTAYVTALVINTTQKAPDELPSADTPTQASVPEPNTSAIAVNITDEAEEPQEAIGPQPTEPIDQPITIDYEYSPIDRVLADIAERSGLNLVVNWPAVELSGIARDQPISLRLRDVPVREVIRLVLEQVNTDAFGDDKLGMRVGEQFIRVTTLRDLRTDTETRVYDISGLLAMGSPIQLLRAQLNERLEFLAGQSELASGGGLFGDDSNSGPRFTLKTGESAPRSRQTERAWKAADSGRRVPDFSSVPGFDLNEAISNTPDSLGFEPSNPPIQSGLFSDGEADNSATPEQPVPPQAISAINLIENDGEQYTREEKIDQVFELITTNVGIQDEWLDEESTVAELNGNLIIKTTPENHDFIQKLIQRFEANQAARNDQRQLNQLAAKLIDDIERGMVTIEQRRRLHLIEQLGQDRFAVIHDNPFKLVTHEPLSTFSVDVDTASYAFCRSSILLDQTLPTHDAIRVEEWVNYFEYDYPAPKIETDQLDNGRLTSAALARIEKTEETFVPFSTAVEVTDCPWTQGNRLVRIGIKAMEVDLSDRPTAHLVFLLDVSGSMNAANKLDLVKQGIPLLLDQLKEGDKISMVVYAGASGLVLEAAEAGKKNAILEAIDRLRAGGSTAGADGIRLAYAMAERHYVPGGINRVILCTDGDFNVGTSNTGELVALIQEKANPKPDNDAPPKAVYLSVMGFGQGNLNDEMMEQVSNAGNGNYAYIDSVKEAVKTMSEQTGGTLITVAKDVKLQLEFNPAQVASYRLIGYENRVLRDEDFNDDTVDAGDIGAGHTVTALYEVVPAAQAEDAKEAAGIDALRYQAPRELGDPAKQDELLTLKLRYKPVDAAAQQGTSRRIVTHVPAKSLAFGEASESTRFAASVAAMGMLLRGSPHSGKADFSWVLETAESAKVKDPHGYRAEFIELVKTVRRIDLEKVKEHLDE